MTTSYEIIQTKIHQLKESSLFLRDKSDDYAFSALCIKNNFYKNPSLILEDSDLQEMIVDGANDGGIDALFSDPNSETSDLVLIQSKYYQEITYEKVIDAITKMVRFYNEMQVGNYENKKNQVINRFLNLNAELGDESKVFFILYTSGLKNRIRDDTLQRAFSSLVRDTDKFQLKVFYADDICNEIKEAESRRPTVESGKIKIDKTDNYLLYNDEAVIVNASAFCIKELFGQYSLALLARNLRYHVSGANVDRAIKESIKNAPDEFWFKNNGLTIICDEFEIDGHWVKLKNFSIVNGGQTTYNLFKSKELTKENDFYLTCKIIMVRGNTEDQKNKFSLEIAQATNSQKAIKPIDLKANSTEQVRFASTMLSNGIFYQTKRGETVPKQYSVNYKNTDLMDIGKLCLSGIFQLPATSRNKPSVVYIQDYYEPIFNSNQDQIAKLSKELLYMDYYFKNTFLKTFDKKEEKNPNADELIPFAHNARTICIAFVCIMTRFKINNLTNENIKKFFENIKEGSQRILYDIFKKIDNMQFFLPPALFENKDEYDEVLYKLFEIIIKRGCKCYSRDRRGDSSLDPSNYLKKDINYYLILKEEWDDILDKVRPILENIKY